MRVFRKLPGVNSLIAAIIRNEVKGAMPLVTGKKKNPESCAQISDESRIVAIPVRRRHQRLCLPAHFFDCHPFYYLLILKLIITIC